MDTKITGPYTVRLDEDTFVIDGPTGTFGDFFSKDQADFECAMMIGCYAAGQASSPPTLNIGMGEEEIEASGFKHYPTIYSGFGSDVNFDARRDFMLGLRTANAHTKSVTVESIVKLAEEWDAYCVVTPTDPDGIEDFRARLLKLIQE